MILALKLLLTPLMITLATLTGRKWGPVISGWLIGFPLTSGPVSFIMANQNGPEFAGRAAIGILGGQISVLIFCLVYSLAANKFKWLFSVICAVAAFFAAAAVSNLFTLTWLPTTLVILALSLLALRLIPVKNLDQAAVRPPAWDIPARILVATTFVFLLTTFAETLGPQLSGILAPFPIYAIVLGTFAHHQQGADGARQMLRGVAFGSFAFTSFFLVVAGLLPWSGIAWTYSAAVIVTLAVNGCTLLISRRRSAFASSLTH